MKQSFTSTPVSRRSFIRGMAAIGVTPSLIGESPLLRIGIIGLSVHSEDFTEIINGQSNGKGFNGCLVTHIYHPPGNPDVEFSEQALEKFTKSIQKNGVQFMTSIESMLPHVDAIMLLTNDGRPHLKEILPVLKAKKPVYIDKPMAESLIAVEAIFKEARKYDVPIFTSSALRYVAKAQEIRNKYADQVLGAHTYGPAPLQASHTDMFWDGIHSIELLYTVMGTGCISVTRTHTEGSDVIVGLWEGGRIGVFKGIRHGRIGFGGTVFMQKTIEEIGGFDGYKGIVEAITSFFKTKQIPVSEKETIELYAFMHAADRSKALGGVPVNIQEEYRRVTTK